MVVNYRSRGERVVAIAGRAKHFGLHVRTGDSQNMELTGPPDG
jgi:hypothetical protein